MGKKTEACSTVLELRKDTAALKQLDDIEELRERARANGHRPRSKWREPTGAKSSASIFEA